MRRDRSWGGESRCGGGRGEPGLRRAGLPAGFGRAPLLPARPAAPSVFTPFSCCPPAPKAQLLVWGENGGGLGNWKLKVLTRRAGLAALLPPSAMGSWPQLGAGRWRGPARGPAMRLHGCTSPSVPSRAMEPRCRPGAPPGPVRSEITTCSTALAQPSQPSGPCRSSQESREDSRIPQTWSGDICHASEAPGCDDESRSIQRHRQ